MEVAALGGCARPLVEEHDAVLLDLDGVVYVGPAAVPGAVAALGELRRRRVGIAFVTNNASRTPDAVAAHLGELGIAAEGGEVATAAQATARILLSHLRPASRVLVVGADGLRDAVRAAGFDLVASAAEHPHAVVQGYSERTTYAELAQACLAVRSGVLWVAANRDATMPSPAGQVPGNGALVAALVVATGRQPLVAGKPELALHAESVNRVQASRPLVVGDRLDTDILGATRAGCASLLVLTGVTDEEMLVAASPDQRPTYVAADLSGLFRAHPAGGIGDGLDDLRRTARAAWAAADASAG